MPAAMVSGDVRSAERGLENLARADLQGNCDAGAAQPCAVGMPDGRQ